MKRRFLKKLSIMFLAVMVLLSCLSPPGISVVFASEEESTAVTEIDVATDTAVPEEELQDISYQDDATAPVIPDVSVEESADDIQEPAEAPVVEEKSDEQMEEANAEASENVTAESSEEETAAKDNTATETPIVTETEETRESMPAHVFYGAANGVSVKVEAVEGTFPEGTIMTVSSVDASGIYDQVNDAVENEVKQIKAVDITFFKDGVEIQPQKEVKVTLNAIGVEQNADTNIVHIENDGSVEVMQDVSSNGAESAFGAEHFSVYAVVTTGEDARLHVKFLNGESLIAEPIVKKSDITSGIFNQVIYDPGAGSLGAGEVFRGWTTVKDYTVAGLEDGTNPAMTIDQVREVVKTKLEAGVTDGDELNIYAMIFHVMNVTYKDEDSVVIKNEGILTKGSTVSYTVNESYVPKTSDQEFQGWYFSTTGTITDAAGNPIPEGSVIPNETEVIISADVILSVVAPNGYWLIFKENGKGASYTSPQFLEGVRPEKPADPVRLGYEFGGWYKNEACSDGEEFDFMQVLDKTTTVYAKWTPITNARYSVLIWKQNVAANGYDFETSISLNGTVGQTVNTVSQQGTGNNAYARINGTNYQYTGFHLDSYTQNVEINPEGTAVVNVYYNRTSYTLTFRRDRTGTVYKTITALYGQPIGNNFPITENGASSEWRWSPQNSSTFNQVLVYIDIMPAENVTFHRSTSNESTKYMEFYVEALPGQTPDRTWNGRRFVQYGATIPAKYGFFTKAEDFLELTGFNQLGSDPEFGANGRAYVSDGGTIRFYYTRKEFSVNYMDGIYVDGNGNEIEETNRGQLKEESNIAFGANLSGYNKGGANYYEPAYAGYVFDGWYVDDTCTQPYTFSTMPDGGITVYAKWRQIQYRVFLNPGVPESDTSFSMGGQNTSFRVDFGGSINAITAVRDDYELVGWYTDPSFSHAFNFDAFVLNDATVTTTYDKSRSTELNEYGKPIEERNADTERFWITRSLDLYAKWRSKLLGANGINVVFDAADGKFADGTTSYQDPLTYKDLAKAVATTASIPNDNKKEFLHWVIQKWDGSKFADTADTVYPGDTFEVLKAYAHVTENEGSTAENPSYTYLVQLRAEYKDIDEETLTHIDWYANNGTTDMESVSNVKMNSPISIQPANRFYYKNYEFIGWARYEEGEKPASPVDASHLWLSYDAETGLFSVKNGEATVNATQVACDEKQPYHDLYAVWKQVSADVTVHHYLKGTETEVADDVTETAELGSEYTAQPVAKYQTLDLTVDSYNPSQKITVKADGNVITIYYTLPLKITAKSDNKTYDGKSLDGEYTIEGALEADMAAIEEQLGEAPSIVDVSEEDYLTAEEQAEITVPGYYNATFVSGTLKITPAPVTITTGSASKEYDGSALTKDEASITGLVNDETATVTATGSQTEVGSSDNTYSINWGTTNKDNYKVTENLGKLTVTESSAAVTLTAASDSKTYDGKALTNAAVTASGLPSGFTVEATASGSQLNAGESANVVNEGFVIKDKDGNDKTANFSNVEKVNGKLTVNKAPVTITTGSASKAYDGSALTNAEASITGLVNGESATVTANGSQTEVGSSDNTYSIDWGTTNKDNYEVTENLGTLTVTKSDADVVLTAASDSKTYDGKALTNAAVTASGLPEGFTVEATASGSQLNAGESANVVNDGYVIKNAAGEDKTADFINVVKVDGKLTVNKAPVTITTGSASKAYDGSALTKDEASIDGLVNGESATVTANGSQTEVGSSDNTYSIDWGTTNKENYEVTENLGKLTITENSAAVTLTAASDSKTYDGKALTNAAVTASGLPSGFTVEATASGSQLDAGESANVVNDGYVIKNAAGEDKTANFTNIVKVDGKLTVSKAAVTIKTGSASKEYDGSALTNAEASINGLVNNETATVAANGSQTEVGSSTNGYDITWGTAKASNYEITDELGTLEVTKAKLPEDPDDPDDPANKRFTVSDPADVVYNGKEQKQPLTIKDTKTGKDLVEGTDFQMSYSADVTNVGDVTITVTGMGSYEGTFTRSYKITKAPLTVKTGSASKEYDGSALTKDEASIEGLVNGETATVAATGSQTEVGKSSNTYSLEWGTAKASNYEITDELGTLEVTKATITDDPEDPDDPQSKPRFDVSRPEDVVYNGKEQKQPITIKDTKTGNDLVEGRDFELNYSADMTNVGEVTIKVKGIGSYTGDVDRSYKITKAPLTVKTGSASKEYDGSALTKDEASIEGLVNSETATVKANGSQTEVGSSQNGYDITWGTAKATNYEITEDLGTLEVTKAKLPEDPDDPDDPANKRFTVSDPADVVYNGKEQKQPLTITDTKTGKDLVEGTDFQMSYSADVTNVGDVTITVIGIGSYEGTFTRTYKITKAPLTVKTGSASKEYDGSALTKDEASIEGLVNNETATVKANGSQTEVGSSQNGYDITWGTAKASNYEITDELGTLEVTKATITDDPEDPDDPQSKPRFDVSRPEDVVYNGKEQKQPITIKDTKTGNDLVEGRDFELNYSADVTNVGEVTIKVKGIGSYTGDVDRSYKITKAPLTVKTGSASKEYDGSALTKDEASIEGLVNNETATVKANGSQTEVGSCQNGYDITWGTAKASNYEITDELGTLEVTKAKLPDDPEDPDDPASKRFTVSDPADVVYNGREQKQPVTIKDNATGKDLVEGKDFEMSYSADVTNVGSVTITVKGIGSYEGSFNKAYKITPAQLTITTPSANKVFDGAALRATGATITGLVNGETATVVANGSQTAVGSSQNGYAITWGTAKASNYTINAILGTLTVTAPTPVPVPEIVPDVPVVPPTPPTPEPEVVDDDDVPEVEPVTEPEEIDDDDTPVAPGEPTWALINLILSIIAVITAIIMAITFFFAKKKEDEDEEQQAQKAPKAEGEEEEEKKKSYKGLKFLGFIPAAAAVILFILTENMHFKMILVDKWTILTAVFAVIAIVIGILTRNKKDKEDEEANGEQA